LPDFPVCAAANSTAPNRIRLWVGVARVNQAWEIHSWVNQMVEANTTGPTGDLRVMIEQIAKALVDDPAQVSVNQVEEGGESVLELTVGPNDLGRVIGKQGRTARAMRNLLGAAGLKFNKRFSLEILE
jgi:uncharacterized protein